jgi:transposase
MECDGHEHLLMIQAGEGSSGRRVRKWRSVSEKLEIVQLTLEPGARVAEVARAHGLNANQVFTWRRAYERGELAEPSAALLAVSVSGPSVSSDQLAEQSPHPQGTTVGSIHIEFPGRAMVSVESGADPRLLRYVLESLRK